MVLMTHASYTRFQGEWLSPFAGFGNDAVMIFFVLSGYVIAYVATQREREWNRFVVARLARLWSVALPAILITYLLDAAGSYLWPDLYEGWWNQDSFPLLRMLICAFFMNELWFESVRLFTNGPYWSLGYEFWYYAVFAAVFFVKGCKRWLVAALCLVIAGPKIVILLPVWLFGVAAWYINMRASLRPMHGWLLSGVALATYVIFRSSDGMEIMYRLSVALFGEGVDGLIWSRHFLTDYIIGLCVMLCFIGFQAASRGMIQERGRVMRCISYAAGFTFSLYLLHYPLLQFFSAVASYMELQQGSFRLFVFGGVIGSVWIIGLLTEQKKFLWRSWIGTAFARLGW